MGNNINPIPVNIVNLEDIDPTPVCQEIMRKKVVSDLREIFITPDNEIRILKVFGIPRESFDDCTFDEIGEVCGKVILIHTLLNPVKG